MAHESNCIGYVCTCEPEVTHEEQLFVVGNIIRNCYTLDIDLVVSRIVKKTDEGTELSVYYWNRNFNQVIDYCTENVTIKNKDYANWSLVGWM
jgi:signal transduction histidine kinase